METYQFCYPNGHRETHNVFDKLHLFRLMFQIDSGFIELLKYNPVTKEWLRED